MAFTGALMLSEKDNVATALEEFDANAEVAVRLNEKTTNLVALQKVPFGFKVVDSH